MLPYVKINFANGAIGGSEPLDDGVTLMLLGGSGDDMDVMNLTDYRRQVGSGTESPAVVAFYNEVGGNSRLIVTHCAITDVALKAKLCEYHGEIRTVVIDGVSSAETINLLQNIAEWSTETLYAPVLMLIGVTEALIDGTASFKTLEKDFTCYSIGSCCLFKQITELTLKNSISILCFLFLSKHKSIF